jgi:DNA-binding MarR family transcriptional regulator
VRLTEVGDDIWNRMQVPIEAFYRDALANFALDEQLMLYRLLDRLKDRMSEM